MTCRDANTVLKKTQKKKKHKKLVNKYTMMMFISFHVCCDERTDDAEINIKQRTKSRDECARTH